MNDIVDDVLPLIFLMNRLARRVRFVAELGDKTTRDPLDRALHRLKTNKDQKLIDVPTYHRNVERVMSLKKLKFTEDYQKAIDSDMYEWMKHKVAAEVGGEQEREAFKLYEKVHIDSKGEVGYKLWRENIEKDPEMRKFLPGF